MHLVVSEREPISDNGSIHSFQRGDASSKCFHGFEVQECQPGKNDFVLKDQIESGSFCKVYKSVCKRGCSIAIKRVDLSEGLFSSNLELECFELLKNKIHPNIIEYFGSFSDNQYRCLVLELGDCNLYSLLQKNIPVLKLPHVNNIFRQVLAAAAFLCTAGVNYGDCMLSNMVFIRKNGTIKIIDFDSSFAKGNKHYVETKDFLKDFGFQMSKLQLIVTCKGDHSQKYREKENLFSRATYRKGQEKHDSIQIIWRDPDAWLAETPVQTKSVIIDLISEDQQTRERALENSSDLAPEAALLGLNT